MSAQKAHTLGVLGLGDGFEITPPGETTKGMCRGFYRGETCNFNPYGADHALPDFAERFLLKGWMPSQKFVGKATPVTAFGSCFAHNITEHLIKKGFDLGAAAPDAYTAIMREGLVNVYSLLQQFEWALENIAPPASLWHGFKAEEFGYDEAVRQKLRARMLKTNVFIITLGLSEVWYDEPTGGIFWRAVPKDVFDPARHKFRVLGFAESKAALEKMLGLIEKHVPAAKVVLTLSPVPLAATFRPASCITANSASKAILRAAVDEVLREGTVMKPGKLHYFPAFEVVNELFPFRYVADGRHPKDHIIASVMQLFEAVYCESGLSLEEVEVALKKARKENAWSGFSA